MKPVTRAAIATAAIAVAVYLPTMSRSIGFVDRGELSAVATTLGIAHPTGYPTLTLLGYSFTRLGELASLRPVLALNLFAALCVASGAGVMVLLLAKAVRAAAPATGEGAVAIVAALSALGTVLGATWWQQANGFEAYALQALFLPLVSLAFFEWIDHPDDRSWRGRGAVFGFLLGLSLTNHLTTVLTAPAFVFAYMLARGMGRGIGGIVRAVPAFALGLTPYLYLLLRAADAPRFNWGDPATLTRLIEHVTAKQYRVWMFANPQDMKLQFDFLIAHLPWDVSFVGLVLAVAGFAVLVRRGARLAGFAVLIFAGAMTFASGYSIRDIDPYVMPGLLGIGILSAGALGALLAWRGLVTAGVTGALVVALSLALHWRAADESGNTLAEDYSRNLLASLPPRAVLFSTQWDHLVSPTYYLQGVEGVRTDVTVIDSELLRRSWYVRELQRREPALMAAVAAETQRFLEEVAVYEAGRPYDGNRVQAAFDGMKDAIVNRSDRPVCATADSDPDPFRRRVRVPQRMVAELAADTGYVELREPPSGFRYRRWEGRRDHLTAGVGFGYASALAARIGYEIQHGRPERAPGLAREALSYHPGFEARDLPPLPLDTRAVTLETLALFGRLREVAGPFPAGSADTSRAIR